MLERRTLAILSDRLGVPGLLANDGPCGWRWCGPTAFGLVAAWALARLLAPRRR